MRQEIAKPIHPVSTKLHALYIKISLFVFTILLYFSNNTKSVLENRLKIVQFITVQKST